MSTSFPRVLVIADAPLCEDSGGAGLTLCNLLAALPPRNVLSLVPQASALRHPPTQPWADRTLTYRVPFAPRHRAPLRYLNPLLSAMSALSVELALGHVLPAVRRFHPDVILSSPIAPLDIHVSAAVVAALKVPHAVYFMDDWLGLGVAGTHPSLLLDPAQKLVKGATQRLMISQQLSEEYARRYGPAGQPDVVLQNPVDAKRFGACADPTLDWNETVLVYAGAIWPMHADAVLALAHAVQLVRQQGRAVRLRVHTGERFWNAHRARFEELGVQNGGHVPHKNVPDALNKAHWLVVACSFSREWAPFSRYSIQTKLGECLMTGRPVMVVGPRDSACARWVEGHGAGALLDTPTPSVLAERLEALLRDQPSAAKMAQAGVALAMREHAAERVRPRFVQALRAATQARQSTPARQVQRA